MRRTFETAAQAVSAASCAADMAALRAASIDSDAMGPRRVAPRARATT